MSETGFQVWIGDEHTWHGCGIIVGARHVVTCNHVVRQCLPKYNLYGGIEDDLRDQRIVARVESTTLEEREVQMRVVANHPLPRSQPGKQAFDDLCLLEVAMSDADLGTCGALYMGTLSPDTPYEGQGIAVQKFPEPSYASKLFEGKIKARAQFRSWYFTHEREKLMKSSPGFSGAALKMPGVNAIYGLLQGCLIEQVGLFIPASNIVSFLAEHGIEHRLFKPAVAFRPILPKTDFGLSRDMLIRCDRDEQVKAFDAKKKTFLDNLFKGDDIRLFAVGIAGLEPDLPKLLPQRIGPNGVRSYQELRRERPNEAQEQGKITPFAIDLEYDEPDLEELEPFVIAKIANASADGLLLANMATEQVIIDVLAQFDRPMLFVIYCPQRLFETRMVSAWTGCLDRIARQRHPNHPIFAVIVVTIEDGHHPASAAVDGGFLLLPVLNELRAIDVGRWLAAVRPGEHRQIFDSVKQKLGEGPFRMQALQEALFTDDAQQGTDL